MKHTVANEAGVEFLYTVNSQKYSATHFVGGRLARIIMFPDWEGCHTDWARKIAAKYAVSCDAEVILTDHYGLENARPSFDVAYNINQNFLATPANMRPFFRELVGVFESYWTIRRPTFIVGFCSGGSFALEAGRSGAKGLDGVVCIHGNPQSSAPLTPNALPDEIASPANLPSFVVVHGGDDPIVNPGQLVGFESEMRRVEARWSLHVIGGAKHSFTRFDSTRQNSAIGYSHEAEVETRLLVQAQICALREVSETVQGMQKCTSILAGTT